MVVSFYFTVILEVEVFHFIPNLLIHLVLCSTNA